MLLRAPVSFRTGGGDRIKHLLTSRSSFALVARPRIKEAVRDIEAAVVTANVNPETVQAMQSDYTDKVFYEHSNGGNHIECHEMRGLSHIGICILISPLL